ncbi:UDP-N-acetylmuramoyl-L-alanyl-D-glutamate--2, 6-diaminopimelate ligase [Buchnera aphidicola (Hyalopterus amygdali)]
MKKKNLKNLLSPWIMNLPKKEIAKLVLDSRKINEKDVFVAIKGTKKDGNNFISEAIKKKAAAIISDTQNKLKHGHINYINSIPVLHFFQLSQNVSNLAGRFYKQPGNKLKVIGVTGTNGKTTVTQLINQWSKLLKKQFGTMGTLGNGFNNILKKTKNTTSSAIEIQSFLDMAVKKKIQLVTMEVSSHGLIQNRVKNIPFYIGIFTNLTQDHLDYHKNMKQYELSKWSFLSQHRIQKIILNANDEYGKKWLKKLSNKYTTAVTIKDSYQKKYSKKWINAICIKINNNFTDVKFESSWGNGLLSTSLIGDFNINNLLLALACMLEMNYKLSDLLNTSIKIQPIHGRMQIFSSADKPTIIIDYAHTPDALEKALNAIQLHFSKKKIWCIFGCGGERDRKKRPLMGTISEKIAYKVVLTNDNPRNENQEKIIQEILEGCTKKKEIIIIPNRKKAISTIFFQAKVDDIIFISGKGHETQQIIGNQKINYSDQKVVQNLLEKNHDSFVIKKNC